jgi:hypothetical protein
VERWCLEETFIVRGPLEHTNKDASTKLGFSLVAVMMGGLGLLIVGLKQLPRRQVVSCIMTLTRLGTQLTVLVN